MTGPGKFIGAAVVGHRPGVTTLTLTLALTLALTPTLGLALALTPALALTLAPSPELPSP